MRIQSEMTRSKKGTLSASIHHRLLTPEVVHQEVKSIIAGDATADSIKRATARLNNWLAAAPGDDSDLAPMSEGGLL